MESKGSVQSVDRALTILKALSASTPRKELGVSEIARNLGLSKATVYRLLCALAKHRFVERNNSSEKYRLSWGIFEIGNKVPGVTELKTVARPEMVRLCDLTSEIINLAVRDGTDAVLVDTVNAAQLLRLDLEAGRREPLHATALGRSLLCDCRMEDLLGIFGNEELPALTPHTVRTLAQFEKVLKEVKSTGYAIDNEEFSVGIRCAGSPIRNHSGAVVAAISISGPVHRFTEARVRDVLPAITAAARKVSCALGYAEPHEENTEEQSHGKS